ncbi:hypothetical protein Tco_0276425 [Tanacetum coccineum]
MFDSMHESKSINKHPANKTLYHALMESLIVDENAMDQGVANLLKHKKRPHDDDDRDQDPPTGPDQGLKKRKTSKDVDPSKKPKSTGSFKDTTPSQPKSTGNFAQVEETVFEAEDIDMPLNQGDDLGNTDEQSNVENTRKSVDDGPEQSWLNDLANAKKPPITFDDLISRLTVPTDFFFNNDLEYLRRVSTDKKYTASKTKIKATKYDVEGIEDPVPKLWSPIKSYLKEIVVQRADRKLYKFMEGDFPRLHLNDIEDMLLLVVQNKLLNLEGDEIVDLAVALCSAIYYSLKTQGVIYEDMLKRKRLMHTDELYKFSDGTLTLVRNTLDQMLKNLRLGYNKAMQKRK